MNQCGAGFCSFGLAQLSCSVTFANIWRSVGSSLWGGGEACLWSSHSPKTPLEEGGVDQTPARGGKHTTTELLKTVCKKKNDHDSLIQYSKL